MEQRCESSKLDKMLRKASAFAGFGKRHLTKKGHKETVALGDDGRVGPVIERLCCRLEKQSTPGLQVKTI